MERERRRTPRYPFFASAELIETKSEARMSTRVSELSLYGCYLDMMNPFPTGTAVLVKIYTGDERFECRAMVVYALPHQGMGVTFQDVNPNFQTVLEKWLEEAKLQKQRSES